MKINHINKGKQAGFSMGELAVALLIIALLSIGYLYMFGSNSEDTDIENAKTHITSIRKAVGATYTNKVYTGITSAKLVQSGKLPDNLVSGTTIVNPFGEIVAVTATSVGGGTDNAFVHTEPGFTRSACNTIVSIYADLYYQIDVGATTVKSTTVSPTTDAILTACDNEINSVTFTETKV